MQNTYKGPIQLKKEAENADSEMSGPVPDALETARMRAENRLLELRQELGFLDEQKRPLREEMEQLFNVHPELRTQNDKLNDLFPGEI